MTVKRLSGLDFVQPPRVNAEKLQSIIDGLGEAGGELVFARGRYKFSTVFLRSNLTFTFEEGAEVYGSGHFDDFESDEEVDYPLYQDASHSFFNCSLFVGKDLENVTFRGNGKIDMQSVWDGAYKRKISSRGAKPLAFKNCKNLKFDGFTIVNATDLALYFAGCEKVEVANLKLRVHIDGISPDNSKNVYIHDCDVESGDDAIVLKSSYTLNRLDYCKDVRIERCKLKSRCNAFKLGTETNGGFYNITLQDCEIYETRMAGIALESVDGAILDGIAVKNIKMTNVSTPFFVHLGKRLRGPQGTKIGAIRNITFENITATGPYVPYKIVEQNYTNYLLNNDVHDPKVFGGGAGYQANEPTEEWQIASTVCGLQNYPLENISFENVSLTLEGGVREYNREVPEEAQSYPEVYVYGRILPAKGVYFRHIKGLTIKNFNVETYRADERETFVFDDVTGLEYKKFAKGEQR
ncbi:MAG: right-handed parallel beta-helix repeat-containing protein [Clostridia bacterium]|nr:right-handed parallel beta-helix repeat-containing protein [Clostridia bacterium]